MATKSCTKKEAEKPEEGKGEMKMVRVCNNAVHEDLVGNTPSADAIRHLRKIVHYSFQNLGKTAIRETILFIGAEGFNDAVPVPKWLIFANSEAKWLQKSLVDISDSMIIMSDYKSMDIRIAVEMLRTGDVILNKRVDIKPAIECLHELGINKDFTKFTAYIIRRRV